MASKKLFGFKEGDGFDGDCSISGEVSGDSNSYFRFPESNLDTVSASMDSESDLLNCFIDLVGDEEMEWEDFIWVEEVVPLASSNDDQELEIDVLQIVAENIDSDYETMVWEACFNAIFDEEDFRWVEEVVWPFESRDDDQELEFDVVLQIVAENIDSDYETMEWEAYLNAMFDEEGVGIMGNPPASKRVVDDLPSMKFTSEELRKRNIVCAICKDEVVVEEKVKKLPCKHYYHGECINPWLRIRNTCPVCRYELPTDDIDFELNRRSSQRPDTS